MQTNATIKDVAERAGVAVSTVSRVINNLDRVSPETREKVNRAISELGYIRNEMAASIKTGTTRFILTVVPDIINEFYTAVIRGVEARARENGYFTLVYAINEVHSAAELREFGDKLSSLVDGVVWVPSMKKKELDWLAKKPFVQVDRMIPGSKGYSVVVDNYGGACMAMEELVEQGHRKIAYISGKGEFNVDVERFRGYQDVLRQHGIQIREEYICQENWYQETGYTCTEQLLKLKDPPTAIFSGNNQICIGSAEYMIEQGLTIGKDISLVEFDDSLVAKYLGPGITSVEHPTYEMGYMAAKMLIRLLDGGVLEKKNIQMDVRLIKRNSVARVS